MSILLKALKKSEAQRQVGRPPDLNSPVDLPPGPDSPSRPWLVIVLVVIAAGLAAYMGWTHFRSAVPEQVAAEEGAPREVAEPAAEAAEKPAEREPVRPRPMAGIESTTRPPQVANFPDQSTRETDRRKQQLTESFTRFEGQPEAEDDAGTAAADPPEPAAGDGADTLENLASDMEQLSDEGHSAESDPAPPRRRASRTGGEGVAGAPGTEPIGYWQLPQTMRDRMPEFRITVLVYADESADRFVLINGVRLREEEELAPGVTLDEIRRDGVVFTYRNYRFLVKS